MKNRGSFRVFVITLRRGPQRLLTRGKQKKTWGRRSLLDNVTRQMDRCKDGLFEKWTPLNTGREMDIDVINLNGYGCKKKREGKK